MKHSFKIIAILLAMFLITQLIGLAVIHAYSPKVKQIKNEATGEITNITVYNLPYGTSPPEGITPQSSLISIVISIAIAAIIMLTLIKFKIVGFLRLWFFVVVALAIGITINSAILNIQSSSLIALLIALPLAFMKVFKRNILLHNLTELLIYPGIAAIIVPLLSIWTTVILLILISIYDVYAVWHAGFMQKMARYQIKKLRFFSGFFIPYIRKEDRVLLKKMEKSKSKDKIKGSVAILGGGDVVFPIILAGVVLNFLGIAQALIISLGATLALASLFWISEKGKFYPAMPFITAGCLIALGIAYVI